MLLIFDLDGTLLNTIDDLGMACNYALQVSNYPTHPMEDFPHMVGHGINNLIRLSLPENVRTDEEVMRMRQLFVSFYNEHNCDMTRPYDGIMEVLTQLKHKGHTLAVASNKYHEATDKIIRHFFPGIFDVILGERPGHPRKPDPEIISTICEIVDCPSDSPVILMGDSLVDVETGINAHIPVLACAWGFCPEEELTQTSVTILHHPLEIMENICRYQ